ncbi:MAG: hypothetical protein WAK48_03195 [Candidatus Acidiferrum sp.]
MKSVPAIRISKGNEASVRPSASYVLYWMIASRRLRYNFAIWLTLSRQKARAKHSFARWQKTPAWS